MLIIHFFFFESLNINIKNWTYNTGYFKKNFFSSVSSFNLIKNRTEKLDYININGKNFINQSKYSFNKEK